MISGIYHTTWVRLLSSELAANVEVPIDRGPRSSHFGQLERDELRPSSSTVPYGPCRASLIKQLTIKLSIDQIVLIWQVQTIQLVSNRISWALWQDITCMRVGHQPWGWAAFHDSCYKPDQTRSRPLFDYSSVLLLDLIKDITLV